MNLDRSTLFSITLICITLTCITGQLHGENWPGWRGPRGDGTSHESPLPTSWNGASGEHVRWKTLIPGEGHSCPIIWNDLVFVTTCRPESQQRELICLSRADGAIRWQRTVLKARLESKHALNSYASSTPATDGDLVYVSFLEAAEETIVAPNVGSERMIHPGTMVVAAYDFSGNQRWIVRPGSFISAHGFCSNPVLYQNKVILNGDHDGASYLLALDRRTGETQWKTPRRNGTRSYATPLLREVKGSMQLVLAGSKSLAGFDPDQGGQIWNIDGPTEQFVASMVDDGSRFFSVAGYPTTHAIAVRADGHGDVSATHVDWHVENVHCYVPSPVVVGSYLIVADDRGTANCFECETGKRLWQTRMGKHYSASLVADKTRVYFVADDGVTKILEPGPEVNVIAVNELGEACYASPAFAHGQLFLRGEKHLFCIE